jgi:phosphatidyl-myo-inositol alpha-mannosyltransferase
LLALALLAVAAVLDSTLASARVEPILAAVLLPAGLLGLIFAGPALLRHACALASEPIRRAATWTLRQLVLAREGLAVFRRPRLAVHATALQLGAWAFQLGACYATILALGLQSRANLAAAAAVLLAVNLTAIVPLTPSNIGVFQAACIAVLHPFHVDASRGLAYGLILQAVEIFDALVLGTLALLREELDWRDLRRHAGFGGGASMRTASERTDNARAGRPILAARDRLRASGRLLMRRPGA